MAKLKNYKLKKKNTLQTSLEANQQDGLFNGYGRVILTVIATISLILVFIGTLSTSESHHVW